MSSELHCGSLGCFSTADELRNVFPNAIQVYTMGGLYNERRRGVYYMVKDEASIVVFVKEVYPNFDGETCSAGKNCLFKREVIKELL